MRAATLLVIVCTSACASSGGPAVQPSTGAQPAPVIIPRRVGSPYAYEWFVRAEIWRAKNELGRALEAYQLALASSDEDPHVLARYATALDQSGDSARAESALRDAFAQDPSSESAWLARAEIAERHTQLAAAIEAYERAETAAPSSPRAPLALAALLQKQHAPERARAVLARYEARVLSGASGAQRARLRTAVLRGDARAAYVEARAMRSTQPADVDVLATAAELLLDRGHCALALEVLEVLGKRPAQTKLRLRALLACAEFGGAELVLRETDPELLGGVLEVARAYLQIGRPHDARELALGFLTAQPNDLQATLVLGEALLATGAFAEAAERFARIPLDARSGPDARRGLARALEAAGLTEVAAEVRATVPDAASGGR